MPLHDHHLRSVLNLHTCATIFSLSTEHCPLYVFVTQVACHLSKLFDSMAQLKFLEEDGQPTKEAIGMFSKDGEYVTFDKPCMCVGQVSSLCVYVYVCVCVCVYFSYRQYFEWKETFVNVSTSSYRCRNAYINVLD